MPTAQFYAQQGIKIVAPPTWALVGLQGNQIVPSQYTMDAKAAGLDIITWTLERSGTLTATAPCPYRAS